MEGTCLCNYVTKYNSLDVLQNVGSTVEATFESAKVPQRKWANTQGRDLVSDTVSSRDVLVEPLHYESFWSIYSPPKSFASIVNQQLTMPLVIFNHDTQN